MDSPPLVVVPLKHEQVALGLLSEEHAREHRGLLLRYSGRSQVVLTAVALLIPVQWHMEQQRAYYHCLVTVCLAR